MKLCRIAAVAVLCTWAGILSAADNMAAWSRYQDITFSGYSGAALTDFPALVRLGVESAEQMLADAADLRFVDAEGNELSYEVDGGWVPGEELAAWVRIPSFLPGCSIRAYWGNVNAELPAYRTDGSVWGSGFVGVWHFAEDGVFTQDATANNLIATNHATTVLVDGIVGKARRISNSTGVVNDKPGYVRVLNNTKLNVGGTLTMSGWVKYNRAVDKPGNDRIFSRKAAYDSKDGWEVTIQNQNYTQLGVRGGSSTKYEPVANLYNGEWIHLSVAYQGTSVSVYTNGVLVGANSSITAPINNTLALGLGNNAEGTESSFKGVMDECRLLNWRASADWVRAEYQAVADTSFATYGEVVMTQAQAPKLEVFEVSGVAAESAVVSVVVPASGTATEVCFLFGTDEANLTSTLMGTFEARAVLSTNVTGLAHGVTYYCGFTAENSEGVAATGIESFTTLAGPVLGDCSDTVNVAGGQMTARVELVDIGGAPTTVRLYFGTSSTDWRMVKEWADLRAPETLSYVVEEDLIPETVYYYAFQALNTMPDGHEYSDWTQTNEVQFAFAKYWSGAGADSSWNNPANWSGGTLPGPYDTVVFDGTGLTANQAVKYDANQTIYKLVIATATPFKIGSADDVTANYALTLTEVERQAVAGKGAHEFAGLVNIQGDENGQSVWVINGTGAFNLTQKISSVGAVAFVKKGASPATLSGANDYTGDTIIREGTVTVNKSSAIVKGRLVVGSEDGSTVARVDCIGTPLNSKANWTVYTNGLLNVGASAQYFHANMFLHGGRFAGSQPYFYDWCKVEMRGGVLQGSIWGNAEFPVTVLPNATPSRIEATMRYSHTFTVGDGEAVYDLIFAGYFGGSGKTFTKTGPGTMQFTSVTGGSGTFNLNEGRVLVDTQSNSGLPNGTLNVATNAVLGGNGLISGSAAATVLKDGTAAANDYASIEPGTVDGVTDAHVIGTLTIGKAEQLSSVTFGNYAKLKIRMDKDGNCDKLMVYGEVSLATTAQLEVEFMGTPEELKRLPVINADILKVVSGEFTGAFVISNGIPYSRVERVSDGYRFSLEPVTRIMLY